MAILLAAQTAGAALSETFLYPRGALPGNGQGTSTPWPWASTGSYQGRLTVNGFPPASGIELSSDWSRSGVDDEAYLTDLDPEPAQVTFEFVIKPMMMTAFNPGNQANFDWWSISLFTDTGYQLASWSGRSDWLTLHTAHGQFADIGLCPTYSGVQLTARVDVDFTKKALSYSFDGVRPAVIPIFPPTIASHLGGPSYAGYDDVFYDIANPGTKIDKIEIISKGFSRAPSGPDSQDLPYEFIYVNKLNLDATSNVPSMASRFVIAAAGGPYSLNPGVSVGVLLDAGSSSDSGSTIVSYRWDLDNDNVFETDAGVNSTLWVDYGTLLSLGLGQGAHDIHLLTTDALGRMDVAEGTLAVVPEPATLSLMALLAVSLPKRRGIALLKRKRKS